ncbi:MAG TPA: glycosyltransferase family 2 protein [Candidatus Dormibacteraeota bacterium]|jgi:GT2 family glycosyltransferase
MSADVTAVIVSYQVRQHLARCLRSVLSSTYRPEVIVVDNASADGSPDLVAREFPRVQLIRNSRNLGFATASNQGIRASTRSYVLSLNPDTEVTLSAIRVLRDYLEDHPEVGAVGPKIIRPDGSLDFAARRSFPTVATAFARLSRLSRLFPTSPRFARYNLTYRSPDETQEMDAGTGACLLLRRSALDQVGLFDEAFFMYGEDLDLCYRLKQGGWKIVYLPAAEVLHYKGESSRQVSYRMIREFHRSMLIFFNKHYRSTTPWPVAQLVAAGIAGRCATLLMMNAMRRRKWVSR